MYILQNDHLHQGYKLLYFLFRGRGYKKRYDEYAKITTNWLMGLLIYSYLVQSLICIDLGINHQLMR